MPSPIPTVDAITEKTALTHSRLLGARLYLHSYIRLAFAAVIVVGTLFAKHVLGIEQLDVPALLGLAFCIALYNAAAYHLSRHRREPTQSLADNRHLVFFMHGAIVLDYVALTVAVWLVGGIRSPFVAFYLPHAAVSCLLLRRRTAFGFAALAYILLIGLVLGEMLGFAPPRLPVGAVAGTDPLDFRFAFTVLAVYGMLLLLLVFLLSSFAERERETETRVRRANVALERLSNMRRDFLHIALHNIQSPVGAVTMYLNNLNSGLGGPVSEKQQHWLTRSLERLHGLNEFLQNFRMLNSLESGKIDAEATEVDVRGLLAELVDENRDLAADCGHELRLEIPGALPAVHGIARLLREAVVNYITNAIKYTPDGGLIIVRARHDPPFVRIEVEDNGIGISEADQARLFHEFVRLNRAGTPVADVAGSGLGLSIVRRVVEEHGGRTFIESEVGRGSTFVVELPASSSVVTSGAVAVPKDASVPTS